MIARTSAIQIYRVIDANFNRAKEALRVCEDVTRFILDDKNLSRRFKYLRHQLTGVLSALPFDQLIRNRDIVSDVGRGSISTELKRKDWPDIFYANIQRSKESVRVLEECVKLFNTKLAVRFKKMRYTLYALEKKVVGQI